MNDFEKLRQIAGHILSACNGEPGLEMDHAFELRDIADKIEAFFDKPEPIAVQLKPYLCTGEMDECPGCEACMPSGSMGDDQ